MHIYFKIRKIDLFLIFSLLLGSYSKAEVAFTFIGTNDKIKITGNIEAAGTDFFIAYATKNQDGEVPHQNGLFELELALEEPEIISLTFSSNQKIELFLQPGDEVNITFDQYDFKGSLVIFGDHERENMLLAELTRIMEVTPFVHTELFGLEESAFLEKTDAMLAEANAALKKYFVHYINKEDLFTTWVEGYINYTLAYYRQVYPLRYQWLKADKHYIPGKQLNISIQKIIVEKPDLLNIAAYRNYLFSVMEDNALKLRERDTSLDSKVNSFFLAMYQSIEDDFKDVNIQDYLRYKALGSHISTSGVNGIEEYYQVFLNNSVNEGYKNNLIEKYKEWEYLTIHLPAPDFTYPDMDSLLHTLSTYKGKYVYIDVWATWCAPCLAELPHFEKLIDAYADHPEIVFMGVSIDENRSAWQKMVINKKMRGIQLLADSGWNSKISIDYRIKSIPRYILIDKNGGTLYVDAPRPSSRAAKKLLKELLNKE